MQLTFATISTLLAATAANAQVIVFQCSTIPNVCENMCWGDRCTATQGTLNTLNYDKPSAATKKLRRDLAGCKAYNRCSNNAKANPRWTAPGYNCDEFPFASTTQGGLATVPHVNRCVPSKENSSQGGQLSKFFTQVCNGAACQFSIGMQYGAANAAPPANSFCSANSNNYATVCRNTAKLLVSNFAAALTPVNDQEHLGAGTLAGAPARWKRASSSGSDSDSDLESGSTKSGTSASSVSSAGSSAGYQYKLADGSTITSAAELKVGTATYTFEYKTTCTLKEYPEYDGTEATIEEMTAIDKENEACFDMVTSKIASEV